MFVSEWIPEQQFGRKGIASSDFIPPAIYLPDGREVPICVIEAKPVERVPAAPSDMAYPQNMLGGGYPILSRVQGDVHVASIGCMVTDGHKAYALTNRHVAGDPGERVYALVDGKELAVGTSSSKQLGRKSFTEIYPTWPGQDVFVNMDVGLVEVDDKTHWTAQIYGIGAFGPVADVNVHSLSLGIIGAPVRAYGCASRQMAGQILALFYRYKSSGGFEHVTDFVIGSRHENSRPFRTGPGDSGTVWLLEDTEGDVKTTSASLRPIAVQWGGHRFQGADEQYPYALATSLGNACSQLSVDVVRDWNVGLPDYWGAVGHYSIALKAIEALPAGNLRKAMTANRLNITYDPDHIREREFKGLSTRPFIPLADVPDYSFKMGPRRSREQPNHFADMDRKRADGKTLLDICANGNGLDVPTWQAYYSEVKDPGRGTLPFRVWQCFDAMVGYVAKGDLEHFICAAGIVSHYIGDACQPLHISYLFNGDPDREGDDGKPFANGVHAAYEDTMVNAYTPEIIQRVDAGMASGALPELGSGRDAAAMTVELMRRTFSAIAPRDILDAFGPVQSGTRAEIADALWSRFGEGTIKVMSEGVAALAYLWEEAWRLGNGDKNVGASDSPVDTERLVTIYKDEYLAGNFLPSCTLDQIGAVLGNAFAPTASVRGGGDLAGAGTRHNGASNNKTTARRNGGRPANRNTGARTSVATRPSPKVRAGGRRRVQP